MKKIFTTALGLFLLSNLGSYAQLIPNPQTFPVISLPYAVGQEKYYELDTVSKEWIEVTTTNNTHNSNGYPVTSIEFDHLEKTYSKDSAVYDNQNRQIESFDFEFNEETEKFEISGKSTICYDELNRPCGFSSYEINEESNQLELTSEYVYVYSSDPASHTDTLTTKVKSAESPVYMLVGKHITEKTASGQVISETQYSYLGQQIFGTKTIYKGWHDEVNGISTGTTEQELQNQTWATTETSETVKEGSLYITTTVKGDTASYRYTRNVEGTISKNEKLIGSNWVVLKTYEETSTNSITIENTYSPVGTLLYSYKEEEEFNSDGYNVRSTEFEKTGDGEYVKTSEETTEITKNAEGYITEIIETTWSPEGTTKERTVFSDFQKITSVEEITNQLSSISVYPNPSNGEFEIENNDVTGNYKIFNASGVLIEKGKMDLNKINLTNQPSGIYFLEVESGNKMITKKLIKN